MRCEATTAAGARCKRNAMTGSTLCAAHVRGRTPGPDTELLSDDVVTRLTAMLAAGNYDAVAARAAGVSERTLYRWIERGREDEAGPYAELVARIDRARAEGEAVHVARISTAARDDWHASAWFLERSYPERWGKVASRPYEPARDPGEGVDAPPGPFSEVDELARRRATRAG